MNVMLKPEQQISSKAIQVFRLTNMMMSLFILLGFGGLLWLGYFFSWTTWIKVLGWGFMGLSLCFSYWLVIVYPAILQRYWRYGLDQNFVRLQFGRFSRVDTVIPMTKVQYVEAEQGPILRRFDLYTLTVGTLNSAHKIPALPAEEALQIRDLIAYHAKITEVDE